MYTALAFGWIHLFNLEEWYVPIYFVQFLIRDMIPYNSDYSVRFLAIASDHHDLSITKKYH